MSLLVTGTIGIDTIYTPIGHVEGVLGGSCTYFAAAASFFGAVRVCAAIGDDLPVEMLETLKGFHGIDLTGLDVRAGKKTFRWGGKYHKNMNSRETLFTELGVLLDAPPEVPGTYADSKFMFLANAHPSVQSTMLARAKSRVLSVADTMDLWINNANNELRALLKQVDGLVLNYDEAELLTGKTNSVTAGRHILEMGPRFVVIKKGEHGALLVHHDGLAAFPAYPTENVIDPTGAGDTFAGGMMGSIAATHANGEDPGSYDAVRRSLAHATVTASFTIESFSLDRLKRISKKDIDGRYADYAAMTRLA